MKTSLIIWAVVSAIFVPFGFMGVGYVALVAYVASSIIALIVIFVKNAQDKIVNERKAEQDAIKKAKAQELIDARLQVEADKKGMTLEEYKAEMARIQKVRTLHKYFRMPDLNNNAYAYTIVKHGQDYANYLYCKEWLRTHEDSEKPIDHRDYLILREAYTNKLNELKAANGWR